MPIAVTEDHESLRATALRWAETHCPPAVPREVAEAPSGSAELPPAWEKMAAQGWLGLHVGEEQGGQGFTLAELAVVLEELGHALFPGPVLPTVLVSAALARRPEAAPPEWLRGLADGSITAAVALGAAPQPWHGAEDGALSLAGTVRPVLGLPTARLVLVPLDAGSGADWLLLDREALGGAVSVEALPALDAHPGRGAADHRRRRPGHGAAARAGHGVRRGRTRPGPDAGGGRERGHRPLVPAHGVGVRQGARAVRPAHRPVPGGQARAGRHAGRGRAVRRGGLGRRGGLERRRRTPARTRIRRRTAT